MASAFPQLPTRKPVSRRVFMPTDVSSRSVSDVSNHPLPNRTGQFLSIRLSRCVPLPIGPNVPSGTAFSLETSPCGPSPCPGRYPRRSSTMTTPSPCGRVDGGRGSLRTFSSVPLRTTHECFHLTWLSSSSLASVQQMHISCASPCKAVRLDCFALYVAFPRSLVRHHSHDYYQSSVAISLA